VGAGEVMFIGVIAKVITWS